MMTDCELLELAAKAFGIELVWNDKSEPGYFSDWKGFLNWNAWNPLTDDGDALRLAAKLRITVAYPDTSYIGDGYVTASFHEYKYRYLFPKQTSFSEEFGDDPLPAIRRAIVRAAAQIQLSKETK